MEFYNSNQPILYEQPLFTGIQLLYVRLLLKSLIDQLDDISDTLPEEGDSEVILAIK
jgi:hypothetical protein